MQSHSAATTIAVCALVLCAGLATAAPAPPAPAPSDASAAAKRQVEAQVDQRVVDGLQNVKIKSGSALVPPEQLQIQLAPSNAPQNTAVALDALQSQVRAPSGVPEDSAQSQIPLGLAAIPWGVRHPADAARLVLPVLGATR